MSQNAVEQQQADDPDEGGRPVSPGPVAAPAARSAVDGPPTVDGGPTPLAPHGARFGSAGVDPVRVLAESLQKPGPLPRWPVNPVKPPFDAQYWACWVVALVYPVLVAYLYLTR